MGGGFLEKVTAKKRFVAEAKELSLRKRMILWKVHDPWTPAMGIPYSFHSPVHMLLAFSSSSRMSVFSITLEAISRQIAWFDFKWKLQRSSKVWCKQPGFQSRAPSLSKWLSLWTLLSTPVKLSQSHPLLSAGSKWDDVVMYWAHNKCSEKRRLIYLLERKLFWIDQWSPHSEHCLKYRNPCILWRI